MTDTALVISDLPAATGLTTAALLEVQVGTGASSSKKATVGEVLALVPASGASAPDFILQAFGVT